LNLRFWRDISHLIDFLLVSLALMDGRFRPYSNLKYTLSYQTGNVVPMGTIIGRTRKDGTTAYLAQILLKRKGQIVHREVQTFDRKQAAKAWLARRETELADPSTFERKNDVTLAEVIDRYVAGSERDIGRTRTRTH
jgi:hypothetical protein